jgi:hypothetical protein
MALVVSHAGVAVRVSSLEFDSARACLPIAGKCAAFLLACDCAEQRARQLTCCSFECAASL